MRPAVAIALACVLLTATLPFVPLVNGYFLDDDFAYVYEFYRFDWRDVPRLFAGDWSLGIWGQQLNEYRPLWGLSFIGDLSVWGPDPRALHTTNITYFVAASALVWFLAVSTPGATVTAAFLALLFFALSPIHAEPVAYITARGHILVAVFSIAAILLFRRSRQKGGTRHYLASIGAVAAALATLELAVALPALLLLRDLVDLPRLSRQGLLRLVAVHSPFWCLLAAYLASRKLMFGSFLSGESARLGFGTGIEAARAAGEVWLSPTDMANPSSLVQAAGAGAVLFLLLVPFLILRKNALVDYARGFTYFAVGWVFLSTIPLMGSSSQRHLFLASAGLAVALGLAAAHLLVAKRRLSLLASAVVASLLIIQGISLASHVTVFAESGELSYQLWDAITMASERASADTDAVLIIIPELPDKRRQFWDCSLPFAVYPPFMDRMPPGLIPSFRSACSPDNWIALYGPTLARATSGESGPIYVVAWDAQRATFAARVLDHADFAAARYTRSGGPLDSTTGG